MATVATMQKDEEEEIDLHLWERLAAVYFEVPWFRPEVEA